MLHFFNPRIKKSRQVLSVAYLEHLLCIYIFKCTVPADKKSSSPSGSDLMVYVKVKFSQYLSEIFYMPSDADRNFRLQLKLICFQNEHCQIM